ncbi:MAG TPA: hypothetical protein VG389_26380 [Myxococcota bacterium]|jgi:hypothetical protein|nr:hypothetical protein [Myxococcota bacterium]
MKVTMIIEDSGTGGSQSGAGRPALTSEVLLGADTGLGNPPQIDEGTVELVDIGTLEVVGMLHKDANVLEEHWVLFEGKYTSPTNPLNPTPIRLQQKLPTYKNAQEFLTAMFVGLDGQPRIAPINSRYEYHNLLIRNR